MVPTTELVIPKFSWSAVTSFITAMGTVIDMKRLLKYHCLNIDAFNFTSVHKNKIKSRHIIGFVWKVNIKISIIKRWALNVNVHPLHQSNPQEPSPSIYFASVEAILSSQGHYYSLSQMGTKRKSSLFFSSKLCPWCLPNNPYLDWTQNIFQGKRI